MTATSVLYRSTIGRSAVARSAPMTNTLSDVYCYVSVLILQVGAIRLTFYDCHVSTLQGGGRQVGTFYCNSDVVIKVGGRQVDSLKTNTHSYCYVSICILRYPDKTPPGHNTPCSFWHRWTKPPSSFLQGGHNTPCNFWQGGQNPPRKFCKVDKILPIMWTKPPSDKIPLMLDWAPHQ